MRLHEFDEAFKDLISITASYVGIPEDAVKKDYYIVSMLQKLQLSDYADYCVFKGGTSLSKCSFGSIYLKRLENLYSRVSGISGNE